MQDLRQMNKALLILNEATRHILHRKGEEVLESLLPVKHHHVVHLRLTPSQEELYNAYFDVRPEARHLHCHMTCRHCLLFAMLQSAWSWLLKTHDLPCMMMYCPHFTCILR